MAGADITNVKAIMSASGNWRVDENGELVVKKIKTEEIETNKLKVGAQEKPEGITIYDDATTEPYCVKIIYGEWQKIKGDCGASIKSSSLPPVPEPETASSTP